MDEKDDSFLKALDVIYGNFIKEKVNISDGTQACLEVALLSLRSAGLSKKDILDLVDVSYEDIIKNAPF